MPALPHLLLTLFLLLSIGAFVHAVPMDIGSRARLDVFVPYVTDPHTGTVWTMNQNYTVAWDISNAPVNITNPTGRIKLRKGNMTLPVILASGFDIRSGMTSVKVPWVVPDTDYSIVLFGDSGDFSDTFTIE